MMFLDCPAYLDHERTVRCGLPAEVRCRFTMRSTGRPLESAMIRCPAGHYFSGPIESLNWDSTDKHDPGTAGAGSRGGRDSLQGFNHGRYGGGGLALRDLPAEPAPRISRPNTAPAYYLGRPARLWITAIGPCPRQAASHPMQAVTDRGERTPSRHGGPITRAAAGTARVTPATTWFEVRAASMR
jgi:hypothetical protein